MSLLQRWKQSNRIMRRVQRHGTLTTIFRAQAANGEIGSRSLPIVMGMLPPPDEMNIPTPVVADEFDGQTFDDAVPGTTQVEADSRHVSSEMPAAGTIQLKPATANVSTPAIVANPSVVAATNPGQDRVITRSRPAESAPSQTLPTHAQSQIPAATVSQKGSSLASGQAIQRQPIQGNRSFQQAATLPGKVTTGSLQAKPSTEKSAGELPAPNPQIDMAGTPEANPSGLTNRVQPSASVQRTQVHTTAATAQPSTPGSPAGSGIDDRTWGRLQTIYRRHKEMDAAEETAAKESSELLPSSPPANSKAASIQRQPDAGTRHPLSTQATIPTARRDDVVVSQAVEFVGRPNRLRVEQSASTIDNKPAENQLAKDQPSDTPTKPAMAQQGVLSGNPIQTKSTGEPAELSSVHEKTQLQSAPSATQSEQVSPTLTTIATASGVQRMPTAESATLTVPPAESGRATAEQHENISEGFDSPSAENNELHAPDADEEQVTSPLSLQATQSLQAPLSLQDQWQVQRAVDLDNTETLAGTEIAGEVDEGAYFNPQPLLQSNQVDELRRQVGTIQSSRPTEAAVDLVLPRRARPVRPSPVQRDIETAVQSEANAAENSTTQRSFSGNEVALPSKQAAPIKMVETQIGPLPSDLWQLIGQPVPGAPQQKAGAGTIKQADTRPAAEPFVGGGQPQSPSAIQRIQQRTPQHAAETNEKSQNLLSGESVRDEDALAQSPSITQPQPPGAAANAQTKSSAAASDIVQTFALATDEVTDRNPTQAINGTSQLGDVGSVGKETTRSQEQKSTVQSQESSVTAAAVTIIQKMESNSATSGELKNNDRTKADTKIPAATLTVQAPTIQRSSPTEAVAPSASNSANHADGQKVKKNGHDIDQLAEQVYGRLKRKLTVERERLRRNG